MSLAEPDMSLGGSRSGFHVSSQGMAGPLPMACHLLFAKPGGTNSSPRTLRQGSTTTSSRSLESQSLHPYPKERAGKHMATINFLIDSTKLPKGGSSLNAPVGVNHPSFLLNGTLQGPEYQVPIKGGEEVVIYTSESNHSQSVKIAPCGIIAHSFKGENLTTSIMTNPALRPIDIPNFDMNPGPSPDFIQYLPADPQWTPSPSNWSSWANNPFISNDLKASMARTYVPFATFKGSSLVSGLLQYGLVYGLTRDGATTEYFYFDPYILINS